ncbi:EamA-like transporter family [Serratia fonticola]|uniref:EamA-like transporter family n=1 Tax=Serratia fonticola TaxID=47917 RepID=A0A4U9W0U0_SERFO|nr:EamA-like transporter family [Serratia fonticola]
MQVKIEQNSASGWLNGFLGMVIFSGSLPATRVAVLSFDPLFLTVARASIAGLFAFLLLGLFKQQRPRGDQVFSLMIVALGVVVGFPLLTALALQHVTSAIPSSFSACCPWPPRYLACYGVVSALVPLSGSFPLSAACW